MSDPPPLLHRIYRPTKLREIALPSSSREKHDMIGLLDIMLQNHSANVLLVGESGAGKTTLLHVLIAEYYAEREDYHNNVMFVNSLKDQGIGFFRTDVKLFCQTFSTIPGHKKIFVLDNVDTVSGSVQQVFRHYIDRYSKNVMFIFTCKNKRAVIENLQSRVLHVHLPVMQRDELACIMDRVCARESIACSDTAREFVLNLCGTSVKTLLCYMEKFKLYGAPVDDDAMFALCTNIDHRLLGRYLQHVRNGDLVAGIRLLYDIVDTHGYSVIDILDCIYLFTKTTDLLTDTERYALMPAICRHILNFHTIHEDQIELAFFTGHIARSLVECR